MSSRISDFEAIKAVVPERHRNGSQPIHPYFGKLDPALAREIILRFSKPRDIVLDPFSGSGSVLHEALLSSRSVIGWDSSPLAVMLATAKISGILPDEEKQLLKVKNEIGNYVTSGSLFSQNSIPEFPPPQMSRVHDVSSWFEPNALKELAFLRHFVFFQCCELSPAAEVLLKIAFSRIITASSNQEGESTYRRVVKSDEPGRVLRLFVKSMLSVVEAAKKYQILFNTAVGQIHTRRIKCEADGWNLNWANLSAQITQRDTRTNIAVGKTCKEKPALVVTSPPYLMSWDYGLYHKFRFYWLGYDLDYYEETEIGRHLRRKKDDVERYTSDMTAVFHTLADATTNNAHVAFVNAPSIVYGLKVDTNDLLVETAKKSGWQLLSCQPTIGIPGPHHGMYASLQSRGANAPGQSGKQEHVLIFKRK